MTSLFNPVAFSTFIDAYGANLSTEQQYQELAGGSPVPLNQLFQYGDSAATVDIASSDKTITVGLVLDRVTDPTTMLSGNWAERQAALGAFATPDALWATYGADAATYNTTVNQVIAALNGDRHPLDLAASLGYVSSAADRTIWLTLDSGHFFDLFGRLMLEVHGGDGHKTIAWTGNLGLNDNITAGVVAGLWFEHSVAITNPQVLDATPISLTAGPLGIGNASADKVTATPAAVAANYHFPLPADAPTGAVALVETNVNNQSGLFEAYNLYRQQVGLTTATADQFRVMSGTNVSGAVISELTLDISVVAGAVPNSTQLLYADLGGTPFNAYQQIFFDSTNQPAVLSSSYSVSGQSTAQSPFRWAYQQLFVDGALANVSVHQAAGDEGSSAAIANGAANVSSDHSSPYALLVGGTSIASLSSALSDPTLESLLSLALSDDPGTVFTLVAAGLKTLPSNLSSAAPAPLAAATTLTKLFESVWQALAVSPGEAHHVPVLEVSYGKHETGSGGIASLTATPSYQRDFGLATLTGGGRGMPDVAALSSGDAFYSVLSSKYVNDEHKHHDSEPLLHGDGGTSAASPLWASLTTQFNAIFNDQGLPNLGFYNDLLYIAAAIAPGAFNDVQLGNNINSFYTTADKTGYYNPYLGLFMEPTGQGYAATPGYDLVSGLGTPNGTLLARALTAIAHSQVSFSTSPPLLDDDGHGGWQSGAEQGLLFQTTSPNGGATVGLDLGSDTMGFFSASSGSFAWTSRLAQQSLQADFDPGLVLLFDKQAQGAVSYATVGANESLGVRIDGASAHAVQASLTNPFGFADFFSGTDTLRVARPVAVAETANGADDKFAVVRLRQGGEDSLQLTFYKVDDLAGTIDGLTPGHAAYAAAVQGRAYGTVAGPGYGNYTQALLQGVDAGDVIAMRLDNLTSGAFFWGFTNANETVDGQAVGHLWNYGLNTWGWEDQFGGGDHDFNDLIVQLDFTSATGHNWLV